MGQVEGGGASVSKASARSLLWPLGRDESAPGEGSGEWRLHGRSNQMSRGVGDGQRNDGVRSGSHGASGEVFDVDMRFFSRYLGGVLLEGGSETTSAFLQWIILAMIAFPEAQKKAQAELDRIVGPHRLPTLDDLPNLPYIQAVVREVRCFIKLKNSSLKDM